MVWSLQQVMGNIKSQEAKVVDARPSGRFHGTVPEPRAGMRGGRIPGSVSVPFGEVLTATRTMKSQAELLQVFSAAGLSWQDDSKPPALVSSCGSGMTACILGLALRQLDFPVETNWAVYDGSWTEYGARSDTEIVKTGAEGEEQSVTKL